MSDLLKSPSTEEEVVCQPLVGGDMLDVVPAGKGDLSDWVELMEAVEMLCPVWPVVDVVRVEPYRL